MYKDKGGNKDKCEDKGEYKMKIAMKIKVKIKVKIKMKIKQNADPAMVFDFVRRLLKELDFCNHVSNLHHFENQKTKTHHCQLKG